WFFTGITVSGLLVNLPLAHAGPGGTSISGSTATAQGNQSSGVASGTDFATPPVNTLNVNSLSGAIQPGAGTPGISFQNGAGADVNINSGLPGNTVVIRASGNNGAGIKGSSVGTPPSNPPIDPLLGIPIP